jgi:hypothetical protein
MSIFQLIYTSRPFGYDDLTLSNILFVARSANKRDGITGALISREDVFMQLLEGPRERVTAAYARILRDDRHVDVVELWSDDVDDRMFADWEMRHDPARSWLWTAEQVRNGALHKATSAELLAIFARVAAEHPTTPRSAS